MHPSSGPKQLDPAERAHKYAFRTAFTSGEYFSSSAKGGLAAKSHTTNYKRLVELSRVLLADSEDDTALSDSLSSIIYYLIFLARVRYYEVNSYSAEKNGAVERPWADLLNSVICHMEDGKPLHEFKTSASGSKEVDASRPKSPSVGDAVDDHAPTNTAPDSDSSPSPSSSQQPRLCSHNNRSIHSKPPPSPLPIADGDRYENDEAKRGEQIQQQKQQQQQQQQQSDSKRISDLSIPIPTVIKRTRVSSIADETESVSSEDEPLATDNNTVTNGAGEQQEKEEEEEEEEREGETADQHNTAPAKSQVQTTKASPVVGTPTRQNPIRKTRTSSYASAGLSSRIQRPKRAKDAETTPSKQPEPSALAEHLNTPQSEGQRDTDEIHHEEEAKDDEGEEEPAAPVAHPANEDKVKAAVVAMVEKEDVVTAAGTTAAATTDTTTTVTTTSETNTTGKLSKAKISHNKQQRQRQQPPNLESEQAQKSTPSTPASFTTTGKENEDPTAAGKSSWCTINTRQSTPRAASIEEDSSDGDGNEDHMIHGPGRKRIHRDKPDLEADDGHTIRPHKRPKLSTPTASDQSTDLVSRISDTKLLGLIETPPCRAAQRFHPSTDKPTKNEDLRERFNRYAASPASKAEYDRNGGMLIKSQFAIRLALSAISPESMVCSSAAWPSVFGTSDITSSNAVEGQEILEAESVSIHIREAAKFLQRAKVHDVLSIAARMQRNINLVRFQRHVTTLINDLRNRFGHDAKHGLPNALIELDKSLLLLGCKDKVPYADLKQHSWRTLEKRLSMTLAKWLYGTNNQMTEQKWDATRVLIRTLTIMSEEWGEGVLCIYLDALPTISHACDKEFLRDLCHWLGENSDVKRLCRLLQERLLDGPDGSISDSIEGPNPTPSRNSDIMKLRDGVLQDLCCHELDRVLSGRASDYPSPRPRVVTLSPTPMTPS